MKKLTYQYVKEYFESRGFDLLSDTYIGNRVDIKVKCSEGHIFETRFGSFLRRGICPICSNGEL